MGQEKGIQLSDPEETCAVRAAALHGMSEFKEGNHNDDSHDHTFISKRKNKLVNSY